MRLTTAKLAAALALAAGLTAGSAHAQDTFGYSIGILADSGGTALADGSRIEFVLRASGSSNDLLTADSFLLAGETSLGVVAFDSSTSGLGGAMTASFSFNGTATQGMEVVLRWFPNYTSLSATTPGVISYGQAVGRFNDPEGGNGLVPGSGSHTYYFLTESVAGSFPDSAGFASLMTVPEPSAYAAMAGLAALGFVVLRRRRVPQA